MCLPPRPVSCLLAVAAWIAPAPLPAAHASARNTAVIQCRQRAAMEVRITYDSKDPAIQEGSYQAQLPGQNLALAVPSGDFALARPFSLGYGSHRLVFEENLKQTGAFAPGAAGFVYSVRITDGRGDWVVFKVSRKPGEREPAWETAGERASRKGYFFDGRTLTISGERLFPE